jgi:hypothetical protein
VSSDISTITTPGTELSEEFLNDLEKFATRFFEERKVEPFVPEDTDFPAYATTKAGASKGPAMGLASLKDILALEKEGLLQKISLLGSKVYTERSKIILDELIESSLTMARQPDLLKDQVSSSGRLHLLAEGGGKTRVICIPDIWTQSVLKPIHKYLMNKLKWMPCDGTFSHEALGNRVRNLTQHRGLFCFDLSAATDRFPLEIQKVVLKPLLGDLVHAWSDLMVNRTFTFRNKEISYAVGQPMGLLSSWAAFSITHHVIINYCKRDKTPYAVIGDDMGMISEEGARRYQSLMTQIGVSINDAKSLIPNRNTRVAEIAKRQFLAGNEISPIPPRVLIESTKSLQGLCEFLSVLASRTAKFRNLSELERTGIYSLILANKEFDSDKFQVTLSCPLPMYHPFKEYIDLLAPLVDNGLPDRWNRSFPIQTYQNEIERFLSEKTSKLVNMHPISLEIAGMPTSPRSGNSLITPLVDKYLSNRKEVLKNLLQSNLFTPQIDDNRRSGHQLLDDAPIKSMSLEEIWNEIVSGPNYASPKDFMEKRKIRQKQSIDLLFEYYNYSRFARFKPRI